MSSNAALWHELSSQWSSTLKRAKPDLVQQIWTILDADSFSLPSLATLDTLHICEKLLWPTFDDNSSNQHALLLATFINYKKDIRLLAWPAFEHPPRHFSHLVRRILSLTLDSSTPTTSRTIALNFIITAFASLDQDLVRKECAPLVSIGSWESLHSHTFREAQLDVSPSRRKAWRAAKKRFDSADPDTKLHIRLERAWLFNTVLDFLATLNRHSLAHAELSYCARFLELLIDLVSQLPTRRYTLVLLKDLNLVPLIHLSPMFKKKENYLIRHLTQLFDQFCRLDIDDAADLSTSAHAVNKLHLPNLQKIALQHFGEKLKVLALSNLAAISKPDDMRPLLEALSDPELEHLCSLVDLRTSYPPSAGIVTGRALFLEALLSAFTLPPNLDDILDHTPAMPTEISLYDQTLLQNETYTTVDPLAIPKLNLQYLTLTDFLWRSFRLQQAEALYEIRKDLESIVHKMKPAASRDAIPTTSFGGFSKMAIPIEKPAIIDVAPPRVGESVPAYVRAEILLDVTRLGDKVRADWEGLKPRDTVFLLAVRPVDVQSRHHSNGTTQVERPEDHSIHIIRAAEVVQLQDEKGNPLRNHAGVNGHPPKGRARRLLLNLDPKAFQEDKLRLASGRSDVYKSINVIARRAGRENNFKPLLESIQTLARSDARLPTWLRDVYLGYGQPSGATYPYVDDKVSSVDFLDTFLDWEHLQQSFTTENMVHDGSHAPMPPYILHLDTTDAEPTNPKKRRRDQMEAESDGHSNLKVSSYKPPNTGPYPVDKPKQNRIRFTSRQVQALVSGAQPGLSLIVGPPGTGKTDVATQLINILYHNFPQERILLVAHSNQALNQLFQKIVALDIDEMHLLRLGHGEEELDTEASFGKYGRVESFMESRQVLLIEISRLAASIDVQGAHGASCETADYFNQVFVRPAWTRFWNIARSDGVTPAAVVQAFPFGKFFGNAPIPELFPTTATIEQVRDIAEGCHNHIAKLFTDLESIRPFEILRSNAHQANHLLLKEARIIAMTTTHAAIRRAEIASLGFKYDTLIMEEAAQITEIESFIPFTLQNPSPNTGELPLKRIVLIGDHLQNSPIIQSQALRDYANLDQSLFLRLIRLGVPHTTLDAQGRCRPCITSLFSWRYEPSGLHNLPHVTSHPDFQRANAGFRHVYQFIDVEDYPAPGQGEREPTAHFLQNLGEAEYAVALFQYMRLLGYPAHSITILTAYAGQRALIRDVLEHRCRNNKLFDLPRHVSTVDKYQGEQNDYIILSLVRTKTPGYLRDVRRLTVALSRARLGLYILGRRSLFAELPGLDRAASLGNDDGRLEVVTAEMWPTERSADANVEEGRTVEIHGVEHLGRYVFEMTEAKIKSLGGNMATIGNTVDDVAETETVNEDDEEVQADAEVDPLHEKV